MNKLKLVFLTHLTTLKKITTYGLYFIFALYIGYLTVATPTLVAKSFFLIIGVSVLSILLLFDYLKILYAKMINSLTSDCDIQQAVIYQETLIKYDFFKGFKHSLVLFDGLLLLDQGAYHECLKHLEEHHGFYHSTLDYLLIAQRTSLQCAYFLEDAQLFDQSYQNIKQIKGNSAKKKAVSPLYSWEEIDGLNLFRQRRNKQAQKTLQAISTERFNQREEAYLFFEQAQVEFALGNKSNGNRLLKEVKSRSNQLYLTKLAEEKRGISFEKH